MLFHRANSVAWRSPLILAAVLFALAALPYIQTDPLLAQSDGGQAAAPRNLTATAVGDGVQLEWDPPEADAETVSGYRILRQPLGGADTLQVLVSDTGTKGTTYLDSTATEPAVRYTYQVRAMRGGEESHWSNYDHATLPNPVTSTHIKPKAAAWQEHGGEGRQLFWRDGDRLIPVEMELDSPGEAESDGALAKSDSRISRPHTGEHAVSVNGNTASLPGGVLLLLDPTWNDSDINGFLEANGIPPSAVSRRDFAKNALFIETPPGLRSLTLANTLATQYGVRLASPNWQMEVTTQQGTGQWNHVSSFESATEIPLDTPTDAEFIGDGRSDFFKFTLTESTFILVTEPSQKHTLMFAVYDEEGRRLDHSPVARLRLGAGTYYAEATNAKGPNWEEHIPANYQYQIEVITVTDFGDTMDDAHPLIYGTKRQGALVDWQDFHSLEDVDFFEFELDEAAEVRIAVVGPGVLLLPWGSIVPVNLDVLDSSGQSIRPPATHGHKVFGEEYRLEPGRYYIRLSPATYQGTDFLYQSYYTYVVPNDEYQEFITECEAIRTDFGDPLVGCQRHLRLVGDVSSVWSTVKGAGVNVAIVDDENSFDHEDLRDNWNAELSHDYLPPGAPHNPVANHGLAVAGIIGARDNQIGIRGIAPRVTMYGYNLTEQSTLDNLLDAMTRNAAITGVSNNSWSHPYYGAPRVMSQLWDAALQTGITEGYHGKGIFYVFAAGNSHEDGSHVNLTEAKSSYAQTVVCATENGGWAPYSETGYGLWVCGTVGDATTDRWSRYRDPFVGTSASTATVSGIAALVRSANSSLTWRDVKLILAASAYKERSWDPGWETGAVKYGSDSLRYSYNPKYGFGRVDAPAAVELAKTWTNLPPMDSFTQEQTETSPVSIPHPGGSQQTTAITSEIAVETGVSFIEYVEVRVDIDHPAFRDLSITLVSPTGAESKLATPSHTASDGAISGKFRMGSARHLGENPSGVWRLKVEDHYSGSSGEFKGWQLTVYGHGATAPGENTPADGAPVVTGNPQVGHVLTASTSGISDLDGLTAPNFTFRWLRNGGEIIPGATQPTYIVQPEDRGGAIAVRVFFTDDSGNSEVRESSPTTAVPATIPEAPWDVAASSHDPVSIEVRWRIPRQDGGSPITSYKVQWKRYGDSWDTVGHMSEESVAGARVSISNWVTGLRHRITGLEEGVNYTVRVLATNVQGDGPPSLEASAVAREIVPPRPGTAWVHGDMVTITFSEAMDEGSVPPVKSFRVGHRIPSQERISGLRSQARDTVVRYQIESVSIVDNRVTLHLETPVPSDHEWITVSYYTPLEGVPELRDLAGNPVSHSFFMEGYRVWITSSSTSVELSWQEPVVRGWQKPRGPITGYEIEWSADGLTSWESVNPAHSGTGREYTHTGLEQDTTYYYRVRPYFDGNRYSWFVEVNAKTLYWWGLAAKGMRGTRVDLTWNAHDGELTGYEVEWSEDGNSGWTAVDPAHNGLDAVYIHTGLLANTDYHYRVRGFTEDGTTPWSEVASVTTLEATNSPATGAPVISGTAQVGETLAADTTGITDEDGLTNISYSYQWQADGVEIAGATDSTYALTDAEEGKAVSVTVSFTDDAGNEETLTSQPTVAVQARGYTLWSDTLTVGENDAGIVGFSIWAGRFGTLTERSFTADGEFNIVKSLVHTYGALYIVLDRRLSGKFILGIGDSEYEGQDNYTVTGGGYTYRWEEADSPMTVGETIPVSLKSVVAPDTPSTGLPTISGTAQVGETLTADTSGIADEDGLTNVAYSYQWQADGADISGATDSSYTLVHADESKTISVTVSFTDDVGNSETLTSKATNPVSAKSQQQEGEATDRPHDVSAAESDGAVVLTWEKPVREGYSFDYRIMRHRPELGEAEPLVYVAYTSTKDTIFTDRDVEAGVLYVYRVQAVVNFFGDVGDASDPVEVRVSELASNPQPVENSPATGQPAISGTAQVGGTLTADTSGISDADGLSNASFSYRWQADDSDIAGATDSSYTLVDSDEGTAISVSVSFTDDAGNAESLTSAATDAVEAKPNSEATGQPTISGTAQVGDTLRADTSGISDADGLNNVSYSYQWAADGSDIAGAAGSMYTLADTDEGKTISVTVNFTDDAGNEESLTSTATEAVAPKPNTPATGQPVISGTAQVAETLTADTSSIADEDGLTNVSYSYQWVSNDGNADVDIAGATGSTYTLAEADEGKTVKVRVSFTDDTGNKESLTGAATGTVAARPNSPATGLPIISGTVQVGETLSVDTSGIADEDGLTNVSFSYKWQADDSDISGATGSSYTLTETEEGKAITVAVTFTDDAGNAESLTSGATAAVAGLPQEPLTAVIENPASSHDGESAFTFELRFSEGFPISYKTLRDHAFEVTGGTVKKAKRLEPGSDIGWRITVRPESNSDVTIVLPVTTDCGTPAAICTRDGRMLSNRLELTVSGPGG